MINHVSGKLKNLGLLNLSTIAYMIKFKLERFVAEDLE